MGDGDGDEGWRCGEIVEDSEIAMDSHRMLYMCLYSFCLLFLYCFLFGMSFSISFLLSYSTSATAFKSSQVKY